MVVYGVLLTPYKKAIWSTMEKVFKSNELYRPVDLKQIAAYQTLAAWRQARRGPRYFKIGTKVLYLGADLNEWLQERTVETTH